MFNCKPNCITHSAIVDFLINTIIYHCNAREKKGRPHMDNWQFTVVAMVCMIHMSLLLVTAVMTFLVFSKNTVPRFMERGC